MKEELQGKLVEILTSIQSATGKAADFALAELPDIAQQYILFGRVESVLWTVVSITLLFVSIRALKRAFILSKEGRIATSDEESSLAILGIIGLLMGVIIFLSSINQTIMVWFAPKVWLIVELARLIK